MQINKGLPSGRPFVFSAGTDTLNLPPAKKYYFIEYVYMTALTIEQFQQLLEADTLIIDTRPAQVFAEKFIPGSLFLGLEGNLEEWAPAFVSEKKEWVLIAEPGTEEESARRLQAAGLTVAKGYLDGGVATWESAGEDADLIITVEPDELIMDIPFDDQLQVIDVRHPSEFAEEHLKDALSLPLGEMSNLAELANFEENQNLYIHSNGNYRSMIASSLLKRQGIHNLRQVTGGWELIRQENRAEKVSEKKKPTDAK